MSRLAALLVLLLALSPQSFAAGNAGDKAPDFPPGLFSDNRPHSMKEFEGKAVVLFFYEQECPTCRGKIPERNAVVELFRGKPVVFIAVAAGDSLTEAQQYARETKLAMPAFADNLSLMEKRYGFTISLRNIYQFRVINPEGRIVDYSMEAPAIQKVLAKAKWKYKDAGYDSKLDQAIESFEWNQYDQGMRALKPFLKNSKKEVAESASKLYEAVKSEGAEWLAKAEAAIAAEKPVEAYDLYTKVASAFPGDDLAKKTVDPLKKLATSPAIKDELAARQMYTQLCTGAGKARAQQRPAVADFAATIAKKYPKTPTGEKCAELAKELGA